MQTVRVSDGKEEEQGKKQKRKKEQERLSRSARACSLGLDPNNNKKKNNFARINDRLFCSRRGRPTALCKFDVMMLFLAFVPASFRVRLYLCALFFYYYYLSPRT